MYLNWQFTLIILILFSLICHLFWQYWASIKPCHCCYLLKPVHVIRVIVPLVSVSDCEVFWLALAQHGDFSCLCCSSGGDVVSDAAGSGGSSKKATQRGSSPLAAVCSPHHILRFLFTGFSSPASFSLSQLLKVGRPAETGA